MSGAIVLTAASIFLFISGGAAMFAPDELALLLGSRSSPASPIAIQLVGSGFLGFACLNWMSRRNRTGGIYARPLGVANLVLCTTAALALFKTPAGTDAPALLYGLGAGFAVLAMAFGWLVLMHDAADRSGT